MWHLTRPRENTDCTCATHEQHMCNTYAICFACCTCVAYVLHMCCIGASPKVQLCGFCTKWILIANSPRMHGTTSNYLRCSEHTSWSQTNYFSMSLRAIPDISFFLTGMKKCCFWGCDVENWVWVKLALWICSTVWSKKKWSNPKCQYFCQFLFKWNDISGENPEGS